MQYSNSATQETADSQLISDQAIFYTVKKKTAKARKWREIEELKSRQKLSRELREIDQDFVFSINELV